MRVHFAKFHKLSTNDVELVSVECRKNQLISQNRILFLRGTASLTLYSIENERVQMCVLVTGDIDRKHFRILQKPNRMLC